MSQLGLQIYFMLAFQKNGSEPNRMARKQPHKNSEQTKQSFFFSINGKIVTILLIKKQNLLFPVGENFNLTNLEFKVRKTMLDKLLCFYSKSSKLVCLRQQSHF